MKAKELIKVPNLRAFDKGKLMDGYESYFTVGPGEDPEKVMKEQNLTETEIKRLCTQILKGNPHWLELETPAEEKKLEEVQDQKAKKQARLDYLKKEYTKKEQVKMLQDLGVAVKDVPAYEMERCKLIYQLEQYEPEQ